MQETQGAEKTSEKMTASLLENMQYLEDNLFVSESFDLVYRTIEIGGRKACFYFVDGFCKDDMVQKILQYFLDIKPEDLPTDVHGMSKAFVPATEVDLVDEWSQITYSILSGVLALFIDGYECCILVDTRTYPARSVSEPEKDKTLRGSKDGFVETLVFNTALIRRRIRSSDLRMEMLQAGKTSQTDIALCYMEERVDQKLLQEIRKRIKNIQVDALTMNQESLAECLYHRKWYNPFPKYKFTERPDTAAAQVLEGNLVILVDNSPSAMILPTSIFDVVEEADDYYFPPITGTYLRLSRFLISILTYLVTPTFLLFVMHPQWVPDSLAFVLLDEPPNIPVIWQFLLLEMALDGLRLASVNTPNMLNTPLAVMAGLVLGEFSVKSGWFSSEVMLYMAFVAIANSTQSNYELGYALKFMRLLTLLLTQWFDRWGYIAGIGICLFSIVCNRTVTGESYIYPLIPFRFNMLCRRLFRLRLPEAIPQNRASGKKKEGRR